MVYFRLKLTTKFYGFCKLAKNSDVMYLRTVNRCKYETLYTLPSTEDSQKY
jgi:hypothetical protein